MLNVCTGTVLEVTERRKGLEKLRVETDEDPEVVRRAINYPALAGPADRGDHVLLNTTAVDLGLGTGGWDFVLANLSRLEEGPSASLGEPTSGHLMKLRYSPLQAAFLAAEEAHPDLPESLDGRPVIVAELHSQIAPALIGLKRSLELSGQPYPRVAYVMPDTAALPLAFSESIPLLIGRGLIHATITCGHAFGGDYEAVTLGSGLSVAAGPADCDVIVAAQGPGNAGTASALGFGGLYQAEAINLAVALGGDPILAARLSEADPRPRHRGLSHHTRTLLETLLLAPVTLALPDSIQVQNALLPPHDIPDPQPLRMTLELGSRASTLHLLQYVPSWTLLDALHGADSPLSSMGRGLEDDPAFFLAAAAAGWVAGDRHLRRISSRKDDA